MRRHHTISPGFSGHYRDLGISSLTRHASACNVILSMDCASQVLRIRDELAKKCTCAVTNITFDDGKINEMKSQVSKRGGRMAKLGGSRRGGKSGGSPLGKWQERYMSLGKDGQIVWSKSQKSLGTSTKGLHTRDIEAVRETREDKNKDMHTSSAGLEVLQCHVNILGYVHYTHPSQDTFSFKRCVLTRLLCIFVPNTFAARQLPPQVHHRDQRWGQAQELLVRCLVHQGADGVDQCHQRSNFDSAWQEEKAKGGCLASLPSRNDITKRSVLVYCIKTPQNKNFLYEDERPRRVYPPEPLDMGVGFQWFSGSAGRAILSLGFMPG